MDCLRIILCDGVRTGRYTEERRRVMVVLYTEKARQEGADWAKWSRYWHIYMLAFME